MFRSSSCLWQLYSTIVSGATDVATGDQIPEEWEALIYLSTSCKVPLITFYTLR